MEAKVINQRFLTSDFGHRIEWGLEKLDYAQNVFSAGWNKIKSGNWRGKANLKTQPPQFSQLPLPLKDSS